MAKGLFSIFDMEIDQKMIEIYKNECENDGTSRMNGENRKY